MASTIKVDNVQNQPGTNIVNKCGTTITLGASSDTVALAAGASQTGFGRTGTVDWVTTPKVTGDSPVTAATGSGYFLNTTAGTITINLPAGAAGSIVSMADYARTWDTNAVTINANGTEKIGGVASIPATLSTEGQSVTFVYIDGTQGWVNVQDSTSAVQGAYKFVVATGGTPCTGVICGNYKTHTFTGPGILCVSCAGETCGSNTVDYMVSAGGGSGGVNGGGGAGAGGFRLSNSTCMSAPQTSPLANPAGLPVSVQGYPITIGGGASSVSPCAPGPIATKGINGSNSIFSTITSAGGGAGGGNNTPVPAINVGGDGGSGGGSGVLNPSHTPPGGGGSGNTPPTSPLQPQGNNGGTGYSPYAPPYGGGGGGGAGAVGSPGAPGSAVTGGAGSYVVGAGFGGCNGEVGPVCGARYFGGGGGAGGEASVGVGGVGGGGDGTNNSPATPTSGVTNTGGGGGGGGGAGGTLSGAGGSGIVIIRYKFQ